MQAMRISSLHSFYDSPHPHRLVLLCFLLCCLFCLIPETTYSSQPSSQSSLHHAESLFAEKLYGDALPLYSLLLSIHPENDQELSNQLKLRIASCNLEEGNPQAILPILSSMITSPYRNHALYLMSLACKQLRNSSQALSLLQQISSLQNGDAFQHLIDLEKGWHYLQIGDRAHAQRAFENIPWQKEEPLPYQLAQLQLIKIHLEANQWEAAQNILSNSNHPLVGQHFLSTEKIYLNGLLLLSKGQYANAAAYFEQLLPQALAPKGALTLPVLQNLSACYFRQVLSSDLLPDQIQLLLTKAEGIIQEIIQRQPNKNSDSLLIDFYLIKAKRLADQKAYSQAEQLLFQKQNLFSSPEEKKVALLKFAEAAPTYEKRQKLYQEITDAIDLTDAFKANVWFLKGMNDFQEGLIHQKHCHPQQMDECMHFATEAFAESAKLYQSLDSPHRAEALKYLSLAYVHQSNRDSIQRAWNTLNSLLAAPELISKLESPEEIFCLAGWTALQHSERDIQKKMVELLEKMRVNFPSPSSRWTPISLKLEGLLLIQLGEWQQADALFAFLLKDPTQAHSPGEAWFWRAHCADQQEQAELKQYYLQQAYSLDPDSPYAPAAFFSYYSYRDYMRGQRKAIKHLQAMPSMYPNHPLLISAHFLMGLDHKKDHLSEEGQVVRRKDLTAAIEAFQLAESTFDTLHAKNLIPAADLPYFIQVRYRAQLERAQANFSIALQSKGGKREIYLEYAEGVFQQLIDDYSVPHPLMKTWLTDQPSYPRGWAEAEYKLALILIERGKENAGEKILDSSLKHYREASVDQGYGPMRIWREKGRLAQKQKDQTKALDCFVKAEQMAADCLELSADEKLDLWIQQSLCCKELNQLDEAMLLLSKVINDDVISSLRIKAMFLRAEIYELQNRPELALKQLEAASRKGGEWAQKAQKKLEQIYGY